MMVIREEAIRIGNDLHERHFFQHVNAEHDFKDEYLFYRFLADESSTPLNMSVMSDCLPRPAVEVADELRYGVRVHSARVSVAHL